jgi:hypothetical protein
MATRLYSINPGDIDHASTGGNGVVEQAGAATVNKRIELTVDWDTLAANGLSGQQARLQVLTALRSLHAYIESSGKFNVAA